MRCDTSQLVVGMRFRNSLAAHWAHGPPLVFFFPFRSPLLHTASVSIQSNKIMTMKMRPGLEAAQGLPLAVNPAVIQPC